MKNLNTLQTLCKIGKILSKIVFIFAVVGACLCVVGLICLPLGGGEIFKLGSVDLYALIDVGTEEDFRTISAALSAWLIVLVVKAVLAKFAELYFKRERAAGTPFTMEGAQELRRLGILTICIPTGCALLAQIVQSIVSALAETDAAEWISAYDNESHILLGVTFLIVSVLCRYGAELCSSAQE